VTKNCTDGILPTHLFNLPQQPVWTCSKVGHPFSKFRTPQSLERAQMMRFTADQAQSGEKETAWKLPICLCSCGLGMSRYIFQQRLPRFSFSCIQYYSVPFRPLQQLLVPPKDSVSVSVNPILAGLRSTPIPLGARNYQIISDSEFVTSIPLVSLNRSEPQQWHSHGLLICYFLQMAAWKKANTHRTSQR